MTSAKFSKTSNVVLAAIAMAAVTVTQPSVSFAQGDPSYAPPPMFDDQVPPMVRPEAKDGYIVTPKASPNTTLPEPAGQPYRPPVVLPRVSVDPDAKRPAQVVAPKPPAKPVAPVAVPDAPIAPLAPQAKPPVAPAPSPAAKPEMMKPIVEEVYIKRGKPEETVKPKAAAKPTPPKKPDAPVKEQDDRTVMPAAAKPANKVNRDPKESAIKGPKTMPALPTSEVEAKPTFTPEENSDEPTMLERQQQQAQDKKDKDEPLQAIVPRPKEGVTPASFDRGEQGAMKKQLVFQPGDISLLEQETDQIAAGVVKELEAEDKEGWRVQIRAYASQYGNGLASDRRIALSRALSLRSSLISQGVAASRIDVMAEGAPTDAKGPVDRIDLYLYGPLDE